MIRPIHFEAAVSKDGTIPLPSQHAHLRQHRVEVTLVDKGNGGGRGDRLRALAGSWEDDRPAREIAEEILKSRVDAPGRPSL